MANRARCCLIVSALATQVQALSVPAPDVSSSFESGSGCFDDDEAIKLKAAQRGKNISGCAEAAGRGGCQYDQVTELCECSCASSPPPPPPPSLPGWANGEELYNLRFGADLLQKLDLYKTSAAAAGMPPVPCILFVHGGGWSGGDKDTNTNPPDWILYLRQRGYHVASTNYRLAPNDNHPAQIDDVESAVLYLKDIAVTHNLDPDKIVAVGTSAGGHLVSLLGTGNGPASLARVAGVINFFGPTILYEEGGIPIYRLLGCNTPANPNTTCHTAALDASPIIHVAANNTPFLIFHGEQDLAVPVNSSRIFQDRLHSVGANSNLVIVPEIGHDKDQVACGQTDGLVNTEHIYRWINATLSPGAPCDSIVCGGGTIYGDTLDLYNSTDELVSPYCLNVRAHGGGGNYYDEDE